MAVLNGFVVGLGAEERDWDVREDCDAGAQGAPGLILADDDSETASEAGAPGDASNSTTVLLTWLRSTWFAIVAGQQRRAGLRQHQLGLLDQHDRNVVES